MRSSPRRAASASTARRDRRHARTAFSFPSLRPSLVSGVSISYWTSAVLAVVDPLARPRLSTMATSRPEAESTSAIMAPVMPAPMTRTSVSRSSASGPCVTAGPRRACQTDCPVLKFLAAVATSPPYLLCHGQCRNMWMSRQARRLWVSLARTEELEPRRDPFAKPIVTQYRTARRPRLQAEPLHRSGRERRAHRPEARGSAGLALIQARALHSCKHVCPMHGELPFTIDFPLVKSRRNRNMSGTAIRLACLFPERRSIATAKHSQHGEQTRGRSNEEQASIRHGGAAGGSSVGVSAEHARRWSTRRRPRRCCPKPRAPRRAVRTRVRRKGKTRANRSPVRRAEPPAKRRKVSAIRKRRARTASRTRARPTRQKDQTTGQGQREQTPGQTQQRQQSPTQGQAPQRQEGQQGQTPQQGQTATVSRVRPQARPSRARPAAA